MVAAAGARAGSAYLVLSGRVVVSTAPLTGRHTRLRVLGAGSVVGEMGLISHGERSAWLSAEQDVTCLEITHEGLESLACERPLAAVTLLRNIASGLAEWLRNTPRTA